MSRIKLFEEFKSLDSSFSRTNGYSNYGPLNESTLNAAKTYMEKIYARQEEIDPKELTQDQKYEALNNPAYQEIRKMLEEKNQFGYALPFVKFHFEQNIPIGKRYPDIKEIDLGESLVQDETKIPIRDLKTLLVVLSEKKSIVSRLPRQLPQYATSEKINGVRGFEALTDDIRTIAREEGAKWLFERLPRKAREGYRQASKEEKNELINAAYTLKELGEDISERFLKKIKAFQDWDFNDIMKQISKYLASYNNLDMKKKMDEVASLEPQAGILYYEDGYLVMSVRTEEAQKNLCSVANWCINRGSWRSYAGNKALQINIFDYNRSPTDPMFLTGTTISYGGAVTTCHDINDRYIMKSTSPAQNFSDLGYPDYVVDAIVEQLPAEISIKGIMDEIASGFKGENATVSLIKYLLGLEKERASGKINEKTWNGIISTVLEILETGKIMSKDQILSHCKKFGILSNTSISVFNAIMKPGDYTAKDIEEIYQATIDSFETMEYSLEYNSELGIIKDEDVPKFEKALADKEETLAAIKEKI